MASDLVKRLRKSLCTEELMLRWDHWRERHGNGYRGDQTRQDFESLIDGFDEERAEAANTIEQLERELAEALKALTPFAKAANNFDNMRIGNVEEWFAYSGMSDTQGGDRIGAITVGDLRRARAVYIVNGGS